MAINYLSNKVLLEEIRLSKARGQPTNNLAKAFMLLVKRYGTRGNWAGYSYNQDMQSQALLGLCQYWSNFDETRYDNPFAYYTQIVYNEFLKTLKAEHKLRDIRDECFMASGFSPSFAAYD